MTTKWTKGPWLRDGLTIYTLVHHGWNKGKELFRNHWTAALSKANYGEGEIADCELEANAQLIASAPALYEALEAAKQVFGNDQHSGAHFFNGENAAIARIDAALRLALGEDK